MAQVLRLSELFPDSIETSGLDTQTTEFERAKPLVRPLSQLLPNGRLIELSAQARTTTAVGLVIQAQAQNEPVCWIQRERGGLYPPDLVDAGVDLERLIVVHIPKPAKARYQTPKSSKDFRRPSKRTEGGSWAAGLARAAELVLRSGAFGLVVVDLSMSAPKGDAWSNRLSALSREYGSKTVLLTSPRAHEEERSAGPMVSLRIVPKRDRRGPGRFVVGHQVVKNKSGSSMNPAPEMFRGPWGLG